MNNDVAPSRRERLRAGARDEIKAHAREQIRAGGAQSLSLTAIARTMGLTTPALYHYFRNRDELLTALIVDAYTDFAVRLEQAVTAHPPGDVAVRLYTAMLAYRGWALDNPTDFLLIYGNPVPGYHAPLDETAEPAQRTFTVFYAELIAAAAAGALVPAPYLEQQAPLLNLFPYDGRSTELDPVIALATVTAWLRIHGAVMLELVGQLPFLVGNTARLYDEECRRILAEFGLELPDTS
jgi:AcrR family transcriptional regulator